MIGGIGKRLGNEKGVALVLSLLFLVVLTGFGTAVLMMAEMDTAVSGGYRVQRTGEAATDAALELAMAMIFTYQPQMSLPLNIDPSWAGSGNILFQDGDLDVTLSAVYKAEDNINYNDSETYPDEIVRYGRDYNYGSSFRSTGRQPVYTVTLTDNITGAGAQADVVASLGYQSPAALFVKGQVEIKKDNWATEETIEITSDGGRPAIATAVDASQVFIQRAVAVPASPGGAPAELMLTTDQNGDGILYRINWCPDADPVNPTYVNPDCNADPYPRNCWWAAWVDWCGQFNGNTPNPFGDDLLPDNYNYLHPDVYDDGSVAVEVAGGNYAKAREMEFILVGVGERDSPAAALNADPGLFNFDKTSPSVIQYSYAMPGDGTIQAMVGADFTDLRDVADTVIVGNENVPFFTGAGTPISWDHGKNLTGMSFGTAAAPQIVFVESNMNDDGTYIGGKNRLALVTNAGSRVQGHGILVVNGDVIIQGSIDWTGLMIVRGDLFFWPWSGGDIPDRSDASLSTTWKGWVMVGGNLELKTYYGGSIYLGYNADEAAAIEDLILSTVPNRVLSWRKLYPIPD
ncbi:hypothetical protein ACFL2P_00050 [Candidatus Moduliflexota bacterium]